MSLASNADHDSRIEPEAHKLKLELEFELESDPETSFVRLGTIFQLRQLTICLHLRSTHPLLV